MKLLTRHTDYAVRALVYMSADPQRITSAQELIAKLKIPDAFLRQLLQALSKAGILRSHKGKGGGFSFRKKPLDIRLLDVLQIFQGKTELAGCMLAGAVCPDRATCPLRQRIKHIEMQMLKELRETTIASLRKGNA